MVEIDETKVGKRKYNRGRMVEGSWVLGMIDLGTCEVSMSEIRLEICPNNDRSSSTLTKLIGKYVKKGTTIITDLWKDNLVEWWDSLVGIFVGW